MKSLVDLVDELKNEVTSSYGEMISFDVVGLFPNTPLGPTIQYENLIMVFQPKGLSLLRQLRTSVNRLMRLSNVTLNSIYLLNMWCCNVESIIPKIFY